MVCSLDNDKQIRLTIASFTLPFAKNPILFSFLSLRTFFFSFFQRLAIAFHKVELQRFQLGYKTDLSLILTTFSWDLFPFTYSLSNRPPLSVMIA